MLLKQLRMADLNSAVELAVSRIKDLTNQIPALIDDAQFEQINERLQERQQALEALKALCDQSPEQFYPIFVELSSWITVKDTTDSEKCLALRNEYRAKLTTQFKNNKAIKQYNNVK